MAAKFFPALRHEWQTVRAGLGNRRPTIFDSAKLKLTGFYLAVILIFSLALTLSLRDFAEHELDRAGVGDRGVVHQLFYENYSVPPQPNYFNNFENNQSAGVHHRLNDDVIMVNLIALVVGGILSYWFAGRTLKPIEEAHAAQARFAADASHELRTPLASLKVENEVFLTQKKISETEARQLITSNLEEVQRLENLAGNLLALTKYDTTSFKLLPVEISTVVANSVEQIQKAAGPKKIKLEQNVPGGQVLGQADSLEQLLGIVLDNAVKYSPAGSSIFINGIKADGRYYVSVRDEGPGIDEADLPHIFERLYRGDKSRSGQVPGYGLGLALAEEIARANKAQLTAGNYLTGGAQFVVSLLPTKAK